MKRIWLSDDEIGTLLNLMREYEQEFGTIADYDWRELYDKLSENKMHKIHKTVDEKRKAE